MVIHRVFLNHTVKVGSRIFLVEQRILRVIKGNTLIVKGYNFILISADIHGVTEMILVSQIGRAHV